MLLSNKSKHRRASRTVRIASLVGVGAAAAVMPVMSAGTASAATEAQWDKVAACESTSNWSINTGNGFYGGLQFTTSTWAAFGGTAYAPNAHLATKAQQIEIAEKVLAGQGKGAWPLCGVDLTSGGYVPSEPAPAAPAPEAKAPEAKAPEAAAPVETAPAEETSTEKTAAKQGASQKKWSQYKKTGEYTVRTGDTLSRIAAANEVGGGWEKLYELNGEVLDDADLIYPGQQLNIV